MSRRFLAWTPDAPRCPGRGPRRALAAGIGALALLGAFSCVESAPSAIAERILDRYRKASGAKPLPAGGMIHIRLTRFAGGRGEAGREEVLWEPRRYRDSVSSAEMTTVRGIESERAFFIDGDGVTRVVSEPVLRELTTRSYFWRRAWLFRDREKALLRLGPADEQTVSVRLEPLGGNSLELAFSRVDGRLVAVRSPRFHFEFQGPARFRDLSDPRTPVDGEITWTGLPTGQMPRPEVGGGRAKFGSPAIRVPYSRRGGALIVEARVLSATARLAIDASADGPIVLSPALASKLPLPFATDVFGRPIAGGAALEIGSASWPLLFAQVSDAVPEGADAVAGACLFREAIIEIDPRDSRFGLHDRARWVAPEGFVRIVTDDDGNRPVAIFRRGSTELRLAAGSDVGGADLLLAAASAERAGLASSAAATGLRWGPLRLPPLSIRVSSEGFFPDWGDDGRLGWSIFARAHAFLDMPQRWTYLQPIE